MPEDITGQEALIRAYAAKLGIGVEPLIFDAYSGIWLVYLIGGPLHIRSYREASFLDVIRRIKEFAG